MTCRKWFDTFLRNLPIGEFKLEVSLRLFGAGVQIEVLVMKQFSDAPRTLELLFIIITILNKSWPFYVHILKKLEAFLWKRVIQINNNLIDVIINAT